MFYGLSKQQTRQLAFKYALMKNLAHPSSWDENEMAGEDWLKGYRRRNNQLSLRQPEFTSKGRAIGFNKSTVSFFFDNFKEVLDKFNTIPPQNI